MRAAALLLIVGGCDNLFALDHLRDPDPASDIDAAISKVIDAPGDCPGGELYGQYGGNGTGLLKLCVPSGPVTTLALAGPIDTSLASSCPTVVVIDEIGTEACVRIATNITVASIKAIGPRSLVLVATGRLTVGGTIDVSSRLDQDRGAGASFSNCQSSHGKPGGGGGSGGAGGSFGTRGGDGGTNATADFTGSRATAPPDRIRGGCFGGDGGDGPLAATVGGMGGKGGGAVYLIAGNTLEFADTAIINASGMPGRGGVGAGQVNASGGGGGGGGGSGGLIGFDSNHIMIGAGAKFLANGGGGGGGASLLTNGGDGGEPSDSAITTPATGGTGTTYSGKGGVGAVLDNAGGRGNGSKAGGGGGGGVGYILIFTPNPLQPTSQFSPAPLIF